MAACKLPLSVVDRPRIDPRFAHRWIFRAFRGVGFVAELVGGLLPIAQDRGGGGEGRGERSARRRHRDRDDEQRTRCIEALDHEPHRRSNADTRSLLPPPPLLLLAEIARLIPVLAPLVSSRSFDLDFEVI